MARARTRACVCHARLLHTHTCTRSVDTCSGISQYPAIRPSSELPMRADVRTYKTGEGMTLKHDVSKLFKLKQPRQVEGWQG